MKKQTNNKQTNILSNLGHVHGMKKDTTMTSYDLLSQVRRD